jgi:arylsulfatase
MKKVRLLRFQLRRRIAALRSPILAAALLFVGCGSAAPPNVVLITLDTTRADHLGPYGYERARTPNLDRFAKESVVYERAYSASSWTLPSHVSLLTGLHPEQHGVQFGAKGGLMRSVPEEIDTLAELFARAGFRTAGIVAAPVLKRQLGIAQGFESYDDDFKRALVMYLGKRARWVADRAIGYVERFGSEPFFLFVNFYDPHAPYRPPAPFNRGLPHAGGIAWGSAILPALIAYLEADAAARVVSDLAPAEQEALAAARAGYDAEINYMDHHLGRLLGALETAPRGSETLVIITADHGESFGEHYYISHGANLYEDNVRVPLLVRYPDGFGAGTRVSEFVENRAAFFWALEVAGIEAPPAAGAGAPGGGPIVIEVGPGAGNVRLFGEYFDRGQKAIYAPPYKLIRDTRGRVELFDLERDAGELRDLAAAQPEVRDRLSAGLRAFEAAHPLLYAVPPRAEISEEVEEALRALGYL